MADMFVETVPFESKYAFHLENIKTLAGGKTVHRVPIDMIIDVGQLNCDCILDRPETCTPWNPDSPDTIPEVSKRSVSALARSALIPPLPYPETFGAILKEQTERWIKVPMHTILTYGSDENGKLSVITMRSAPEELPPDHIILMLAKETIQDNAKQEYVKAYDSSGHFVGFAKYVDRKKTDRNIWKEQYVVNELGLPIYLKPKAYVPTTKTSKVTFINTKGDKVTLDVSLPGSGEMKYANDPGTGENSGAFIDAESQCRCYTINAIVKPYVHVANNKFAGSNPLDATTCPYSDNPFEPPTGAGYDDYTNAIKNWMNMWFNFIIAKVTADTVSDCIAITKLTLGEAEVSLADLTSFSNIKVTYDKTCKDVPRFDIVFPGSTDGGQGKIPKGTQFGIDWFLLYKVDILKMDVMVNDDLISHIYCGETTIPGFASSAQAISPVPSVWIESLNEGK